MYQTIIPFDSYNNDKRLIHIYFPVCVHVQIHVHVLVVDVVLLSFLTFRFVGYSTFSSILYFVVFCTVNSVVIVVFVFYYSKWLMEWLAVCWIAYEWHYITNSWPISLFRGLSPHYWKWISIVNAYAFDAQSILAILIFWNLTMCLSFILTSYKSAGQNISFYNFVR